MDLKMEVYSPSLDLVGILEVHRSVIWEEKAFGAGSFSVDALITPESVSLLSPYNIIWIEGETAGIIECVQEQHGKDGPYITVKGPVLTGILGYNILHGLYDLTGTPPAIMHSLVNDCCISPTRGDTDAREIPRLVLLGAPTGGDSVRYQKTGGTLLETLEELGAAFGVAFGVRFNPAIPQMEFWTRWGQNRSINQTANDPVFYSTELDDVLSSEYSYNAQDYRNVALVAGEGEGNDRIMVTVESDVQAAPTPPTPPEPTKYTIILSVDPEGGGTATGGGQVNEGQSVTVTASPSSGYTFSGWQENGRTVSTDTTYTFTAAGNRALVAAFTEIISSGLPDGYTEVEYIQSNGTQYIDTEVQPANASIIIDFEPLAENSTTTSKYAVFSNYIPTSGTRYYFMLAWRSDGLLVSKASASGSASYISLSSNTTPRRMVAGIDYPNKKAFLVGESEVDLPSNLTSTSMRTIRLLGATATNANLAAKLYSCQINVAGTQVRNFVPCINPSGHAGLYDLVNSKFYPGTGTFTTGPTV